MPVYNEEEAIGKVIDEWLHELKESGVNFTLCILNDGSKDSTLKIIQDYAAKYSQIKVVDKPNTGHGQTCVYGYKLALDNSADWILQIDSDGQCDPVFLRHFLAASNKYKAIYGFRKNREDGFSRYMISRVVSLFTFAATGIWIKDANVPYRLINVDIMQKALPFIHKDFYLANIYLSVLVRKQIKIQWVNITFRQRSGGVPSIKLFSFARHGLTLFKQLKETARAKT